MRDPEFRAAYEAEERKERLQALLAEWRDNAGLTSSQVAERMGIKPPTISRMEKNITSASFETLARYAKACGVTSATLFF
ncbi:MAG TPA: XRE family transcriptional regulator [Erwinia sp.]|nr:XRE family transcriptional regulator [Erwinia sp.]